MSTMDEYQDIKKLLQPRRAIGASAQLRQRIQAVASVRVEGSHHSSWWLRSGVAAACVALTTGAIMLFNSHSFTAVSTGTSDCMVYVGGQKASDGEAQAIVEADVAKMERFLLTVERLNAAEQEKVEQFMQHQSQPK